MSNTKTESTAKKPKTTPAKSKVGYIVALVAGLLIVFILAFYFIYMGINHAGRWLAMSSNAIEYSVFDDTDFIVLRTEDDIEQNLRSERYFTDKYRLDIANYDYLIIHYDYMATESGFYETLKDARINEITSDGVAKIYLSYRADLFSSIYYDVGSSEETVLFEGKKGSFDGVKKLELSGVKIAQPEGPEPDEPYDYLSEGVYLFGGYDVEYDSRTIQIFSNYQEYASFVEGVSSFRTAVIKESDFEKYDYAVVPVVQGDCGGSVEKVGLYSVENGRATVIAEMHGSCGPCAPEYFFYAVPIEKGKAQKVELKYEVTNTYHCDPDVSYKPVIYLYPTETTDVSVKLGAPEKLLVSYPTYIDGWKVTAQPNGDLRDLKTGRGLYSLYYEADNTTTRGLHDTGFVVKGEDTVSFLEDKLAELGLNDREAEEFIVYWLPQMQHNAYNYIYFATGDEVAKNMPLNVSPAPKTSIRINMEWKALDAPIKVKPQALPQTPIRDGFTLVEWGGTIL